MRLKAGRYIRFGAALVVVLALQACAQADVPDARVPHIPAPMSADDRAEAINEKPDAVLYLPLGQDALLPVVANDDPLPDTMVGPFELRSETLAGALQLILADYEIPLAFETEEGLTRRITVANLQGPLNTVVRKICGLADLYCAYEDGLLIVKERETFSVKIPPISQDASFMQNVAGGLAAIIGAAPIIDQSTRTIVYETTNRHAEMAMRYFQRMRSSTALIVFETYIWEVTLNSGNSTGIQWDTIETFGKFVADIDINGAIGAEFAAGAVSIGLPTTQGAAGGAFNPTDVFDFLSTFGAVKTISQPQITVLSGSEARLRAASTQNYVARVAQTIDDGQTTTSVETASVDTGFTITINSAWDNATVYAAIEIDLSEVSDIIDFDFTSGDGGTTTVQLPNTTEREVSTQVRIRPGDSLLLAGLVRESDAFSSSGPGLSAPFIPHSRTGTASNVELVFLLRPRVVVFTSPAEDKHYNFIKGSAVAAAADSAPAGTAADLSFTYDFAPLVNAESAKPTEPILGTIPHEAIDPGGSQ